MDLKSVHEIFNNRILRIPSYQRGYTWANDDIIEDGDDLRKVKGQLKDLWDDLMNIPDGSCIAPKTTFCITLSNG